MVDEEDEVSIEMMEKIVAVVAVAVVAVAVGAVAVVALVILFVRSGNWPGTVKDLEKFFFGLNLGFKGKKGRTLVTSTSDVIMTKKKKRMGMDVFMTSTMKNFANKDEKTVQN